MATAEKRVVTDATGQAILAELRKIPGVMNPVPIEKGGTGASTPEEAREAIGAQEKLGFNVSEELNKRIKSVNEILPDENGNVQIIRVPMADNFTSDESHIVSGTFIERTTGGDTSITDGNAYLGVLYGNSVRSGYTAETKNFETRLAERTDDSQPMTAEINWDTFRSAVNGISTNKTFSYTTTWNENPETYGIVIGGTPKSGDVINVYFIAENRGVIANATPETFNSTNWNLYDNETGYAKVLKYSDVHGFKIGGTYTGISFSATLDGEKTVITPDSDGLFTIPSDGYVFVTGGNNTDTYVLMTWSDWEDGYTGDFMTKNVSTIDFSEVMHNVFPFGLCTIGIVTDEINFNDRVATVRIERVAYSTENRIIAENSGRDYVYDADWIYSVKETPEKVRFNIDNDLLVYDHGVEYFTGTEVPLTAFELFGQNLKDKLRREVVAVTPQNFSASQKQIARENIEAAWNSEVIKSINNKVPDANGNITIVEGQSNASYGSYRIDPVIPPAAWSLVNGQYQVAYSDPLIKATMTGSETWLDNNDAMLGKTTFNTIDGALLIVTAVQPTETWRLHVLLAENGATVLEEVNNKVDESDLAIVETDNTAFHSIFAGQYVMWNGEMYKAIANIASGAALSATGTGANLSAVTGGVVNEMNSIYGTFGNTSNPITDLNDLPMYGSGHVVLDSSISPIGVSGSFSFTKQGAASSNRYTVTVSQITANSSNNGNVYVGYVYNGNLTGWEQIALKKEVDALSSNLSNLIPTTGSIYTGDLNDLPTGRVYTGAGITNAPTSSSYWFVDTIVYGTNAVQYAQDRNAAVNVWTRNKSQGTWREWEKLALNSTKADTIKLTDSDTTASAIWAKLNVLTVGYTACFFASTAAMTALSSNARATSALGTVSRWTTNQFEFLFKYPTNKIASARLTGVSSTAIGTYTEEDLSGKFTTYFDTLADFKSYVRSMPVHSSVQFICEGEVTGAISNGLTALSIMSGTLSKVTSAAVNIKWSIISGHIGSSMYSISNETFTDINLDNVVNTSVLTDLNYEPPKPNLIYMQRYNSSTQHIPDTYSGMVFTLSLVDDGSNVLQFAISYSGKIYTRRKSSGTWGEFVEK